MTLELWAQQALEDIGVDGVFAPYIVGMLKPEEAVEDEEEIKFNIHQVLMGWLSPEDEEKAHVFVENLVKYSKNSSLLKGAIKETTTSADLLGDGGVDRIEQLVSKQAIKDVTDLKPSASAFVPRAMNFVPPDETGIETEGYYPEEHVDGYHEQYFDKYGYPIEGHYPEEVVVTEAEEDEDAFFWSVAFDLVSHLQLKFPDMDPARLCDLLRAVELDVDKAHAVLKATVEKETIGSTQVCRHYLQGECRRADCMFLHDTHFITCRFWLRGGCLQEQGCVFAHDFIELYNLDEANLKRDYDSEDEGDADAINFEGEEMFPSLGSDNASAVATFSSTDYGGALSMDFARAVSLNPPAAPVSLQYGGMNSAYPQAGASYPRSLYHKTTDALVGNKWVKTGSSVAAQYADLRENAYQMACARNKCFMSATRAYRNGNRALAKSLSIQGHEYNARMKELHYMAAVEIFESRNAPSQIYTDRILDLHGLHVAEAVEFLTHYLPKLAEEGLDTVHVVTGSGHHSKGPQSNARLLPAVENFLSTEGYQFSRVADRKGHVGMLLVDLRW